MIMIDLSGKEIIEQHLIDPPRPVYAYPHGWQTLDYLYHGNYVELVPNQAPVEGVSELRRRASRLLGRDAVRRKMHVIQSREHTPIDHVTNDYYRDELTDPMVVDVSVYGSAIDIPASMWPSEEEVSTEEVLRNIELLHDVSEQRWRELGL